MTFLRHGMSTWGFLLLFVVLLQAGPLPKEIAEAGYGWIPRAGMLQEGQFADGQTLENLLLQLEVPQDRIAGLCDSFRDVGNPRLLQAGQKWNLLQDERGERWLNIQNGLDRRYRMPLEGGHVLLDSLDRQRVLCMAEGTIQDNLWDALINAGGDPAAVMNFVEIFQWDVDFLTDIRSGDRFWLVWEEELYEGGWLPESRSRSGRILAARFQQKGTDLRAIYSELGDTPGYFNQNGQSLQKQFLRSPLNYRRISSGFGTRRHPIARKVRLHKGVDYAAASGTPVVSSASGTVEYAGWQKGYGNVVRIKHNNRFTTLYGHLKGFAKGIRKGVRVEQNQLIAYVGATGLATGPHLHYEMIEHGRSIDPFSLKNATIDPIDASRMALFQDDFRRCFPLSRDQDWRTARQQADAGPDS